MIRINYIFYTALLPIVSAFLAGCGNPNLTQDRLVNAARNDDLPAFRKLASTSDVSLDAQEIGMLGYTPLVGAVLSDGTNVFSFLLAAGANVNARIRTGETPLMMATLKGDANVDKVIALIGKGADVNAKDPDGNTVLRHAAAAGASNIVQILKTNGVVVTH
jgi:ankyrin repeat protein